MKKLLGIIVLGLLLSGNAYAAKFFIGKEIKDNFIYDKNIQISLDGGNWVVIRNNTSLDYSIKQRIVGIGRVENNEIMEMIELYKGDLAGYYIHYINQAILEIVFKDKHDGCYERPEYYLLELYRRGSSHNCMIVRHMDVTKELNYPDGPFDKAAASAYNSWIKKNSLKYPKIMLESQHSYFSRLSGGNWIQLRHYINPKLLNAPESNFFTEETSEYHKANISQHLKHKEIMDKWIAISSKFHKDFENMVKAKTHHKLNLDQYNMKIENIKKISVPISEQLQALNDLYKSGALTKEEFTKAKNKLLN